MTKFDTIIHKFLNTSISLSNQQTDSQRPPLQHNLMLAVDKITLTKIAHIDVTQIHSITTNHIHTINICV